MGASQILIALAVLPGAILMYMVYKLDNKYDREPLSLIAKLLAAGALVTLAALILEIIGGAIIEVIFGDTSLIYQLLENFLVVAVAEEGVKYLALKKLTWKNRAFNFSFDGIVYAVSVSLGFAILENIEYSLSYGMGTALIRAFTAVPAHTIFGIFMGSYYGIAKIYHTWGYIDKEKKYKRLTLLIPVLLHGFYDFAASSATVGWSLVFLVFVIVVDVIAFIRIRKCAKNDMLIV